MTAVAPLYTNCARCGARVLEVRWDWQADILLGDPRLDPVALDHQQITACILIGVRLWQLQQRLTGTWTTSSRGRWWPRGPVTGHTLPEHACGRRWDAFPVDLATTPTPVPELCPF